MSKFKKFTKEEFSEYLFNTSFERRITRITLHFMWRKKGNEFWGEKSLLGLEKYYKNQGRNKAFHFVISDNDIWEFLNIEKQPEHTGKFNIGSIDIEVDAVIGHRKPSAVTWDTFLFVVRKLMQKFNLDPNKICFHSEVDKKAKNCPDVESKDWFLEQLIEDEEKIFPLNSADQQINEDLYKDLEL